MEDFEDEDLKTFLLTSDFNELNYSSNQFKYFLINYQKYYRLALSKNIALKSELENLETKISNLEKTNTEYVRQDKINKAIVENYRKSYSKKLSLKERLIGKFINRFKG